MADSDLNTTMNNPFTNPEDTVTPASGGMPASTPSESGLSKMKTKLRNALGSGDNASSGAPAAAQKDSSPPSLYKGIASAMKGGFGGGA